MTSPLKVQINCCSGTLNEPSWGIVVSATDSCANTGSGTATANFTVTVTQPTASNEVCWLAKYTVTNVSSSTVINLTSITAAVGAETATYALGTITLLPNQQYNGLISDCYAIAACDSPQTYNVALVANGTVVCPPGISSAGCLPLSITGTSVCDCAIDVPACSSTCYYLSDIVSVGGVTLPSVNITSVKGATCTSLQPIVNAINQYGYYALKSTDHLMVCTDCPVGGTITFAISAATSFTAASCPAPTFTDTAELVAANDAATCDTSTATITPACYTPGLCCTITACVPLVDVCETSVVQQPNPCCTVSKGAWFSGPLANSWPTQYIYFTSANTNSCLQPWPAPSGVSWCSYSVSSLITSTGNYSNGIVEFIEQYIAAVFNIDASVNTCSTYVAGNSPLFQCICGAYSAISAVLAPAESNCVNLATLTSAQAQALMVAKTTYNQCLNDFNTSAESGTASTGSITYSITPTVSMPSPCSACLQFALYNACAGSYDYVVLASLGTTIFPPIPSQFITSGSTTGSVVACNNGSVPPGCDAIISACTTSLATTCISYNYLQYLVTNGYITSAQTSQVSLGVIISSLGLSCNQLIPPAIITELSMGICIDATCETATCCDALSISLIEPAGIDSASLIALQALYNYLADNNCSVVEIINQPTATAQQQIDAFLAFGLSYVLSLSGANCCNDTANITNTFTIEGANPKTITLKDCLTFGPCC